MAEAARAGTPLSQGMALGRLGEPSTASAAAWAAAGAVARMLPDAPLPRWPGPSLDEIASRLDSECEWLVTNGVLPPDRGRDTTVDTGVHARRPADHPTCSSTVTRSPA